MPASTTPPTRSTTDAELEALVDEAADELTEMIAEAGRQYRERKAAEAAR